MGINIPGFSGQGHIDLWDGSNEVGAAAGDVADKQRQYRVVTFRKLDQQTSPQVEGICYSHGVRGEAGQDKIRFTMWVRIRAQRKNGDVLSWG